MGCGLCRFSTAVFALCIGGIASAAGSSWINPWFGGGDDGVCNVYMAPSTIPGAGVGMYTTKARRKGEMVVPGDLVVPVMDIEFYHPGRPETLWNEYHWEASDFPTMESDGDVVSGISFGIGALANSFLALVNVAETRTLVEPQRGFYANAPTAGSATPYHDRRTQATRPIQAGEELFVSYGENYFQERTHPSQLGYIPVSRHYKTVNELLYRFQTYIRNHPYLAKYSNQTGLVHDLYENMYDILAGLTNTNLHWITPPTLDVWDALLQEHGEGGKANREAEIVEWLHHNRSVQPVEWIRENGACLDNIRPGPSEVAALQRGAIATRTLSEGTVVAPVPVIPIYPRSLLTMYPDTVVEKGGDEYIDPDTSRILQQQLILNYCFGHNQTDLLLCPYGVLTGLVNHAPTEPTGGMLTRKRSANVRLEWSKNPYFMSKGEWLDEHPEQWAPKARTTGLTLELVATRTIHPGEEVLLDYGTEWQEAWDRHVEAFETTKASLSFEKRQLLDAHALNSDRDAVFDPLELQRSSRVVATYCRRYFMAQQGLNIPLDNDDYLTIPCKILHRNEQTGLYTAEGYKHTEHDTTSTSTLLGVAFDLPRDTFAFDSLYRSKDFHHGKSFRHDMRLPDHLLPPIWRRR